MSFENVPTQREALVEKTRQLKQAVEDQISSFQQDLSKSGKTALIVGGAFLAGYTIYRAFFGRKKVYVPVKDGQELVHIKTENNNGFWAMVQGALTSLLLAIAREKLLQLLDQYTKQNESTAAAPAAGPTQASY